MLINIIINQTAALGLILKAVFFIPVHPEKLDTLVGNFLIKVITVELCN